MKLSFLLFTNNGGFLINGTQSHTQHTIDKISTFLFKVVNEARKNNEGLMT